NIVNTSKELIPIISMLILDVSNSTKASPEIYNHLSFIERKLRSLNTDNNKIYMNYRIGEELFIISSQPYYTILLSFYAKSLWPASDFPLKCSFHTVHDSYPEYNPDRWNHPSIKAVRESLQTIKKSKLQYYASQEMPKGIELALMYGTDIFRTVTPLQQEVMQYYLTGITQKEIAKLTKRSVSTISKHVHASRVKQLTEIINYVSDQYELN